MTRFILLLTLLLPAGTPLADDAILIRYRDLPGPLSLTMSVTMNQEIEAMSIGEVVAGRDFAFDLTMGTDPASGAAKATIDRARASYVAHGMKQRLGTRHITGQSFPISLTDDGRALKPPGAADGPEIDLGPMIGAGFSVAALLADTLPVFPEEAVSVGTTWKTERPVRSLEGWAFGTGRLSSSHRVTAIDQHEGHTIVTGETEGTAELAPAEGERGYDGDLKRTLRWSLDATAGRLLSLSMDQETEGETSLPQGETRIRQRTRIEVAPRERETTK